MPRGPAQQWARAAGTVVRRPATPSRVALLTDRSPAADAPPTSGDDPMDGCTDVRVAAGDAVLDASLTVPEERRGVVVFAHGSGSSRHSPRNRFVAEQLQRAGYATLLLDLLTPAEEAVDRVTGQHRFDVELLGDRVAHAVDWTEGQPALAGLPLGLFGASTGAAAALRAAAARPALVRAVVSRGGRPDLAGPVLDDVRTPTLLLVGGADEQVLRVNRRAAAALGDAAAVTVVPGAGHLFTEPGALEQVVEHAQGWFDEHLGPAAARSELVAALLDRHGCTFAEEAGIELADDPEPLYQLLVLSTLLSAPIPASTAVSATRALLDDGLTTPRAMQAAGWHERVAALDRGGYRRLDERTATMLGDGARLCQGRWGGDLRRLHAQSTGAGAGLARLLTEFPGIGPVGAEIFLREVQGVWPDVRPRLDRPVLDGAERLGLPASPAALAGLVSPDELPRLAAALVRVALDERAAAEVRRSAG